MANETANKPAGARSFEISGFIAAGLIGIVAVCLAWPQIFPPPDRENQLNLPNLSKRAAMLRQTSDPLMRDRLCIGLSYEGRALDRALPPTARVFITGMLGPTNAPGIGYYFFLRNYLFPRDVEISLDGKATFVAQGFNGVPCDSPEILKSNGFDVVLGFPNNQLQLLPLTTNGIPHMPGDSSQQ